MVEMYENMKQWKRYCEVKFVLDFSLFYLFNFLFPKYIYTYIRTFHGGNISTLYSSLMKFNALELNPGPK